MEEMARPQRSAHCAWSALPDVAAAARRQSSTTRRRRAADLVDLVGGRGCRRRGRRSSSRLAIKSKGTMTVAADASYAPNEFIGSDGHTVVGMDADLCNALAAVMGLKATSSTSRSTASSPAWPPASTTSAPRRSPTPRRARRRSTSSTTSSPASRSTPRPQGGTTISGLADLCGKTVAVEKGTTEETDATAQSKKCTSAGKPARDGAGVPGPERGQPGASRAAARSSASPTRRSPPTRSRSQAASSSSSAPHRHRAVRPRGPEASGARPRRAGGAQGADQERHVHDDPHQVGRSRAARSPPRGEDQRRHELALGRSQTDRLRGEHLRAIRRRRPGRPEDIKAVPVRHPGRWIAAAIVLVIAASIVRSVVTNTNFQWTSSGSTCSTRASCTGSS